MKITRHAQLVHEFHTIKALLLESNQQGDFNQQLVLMQRLQDVSEQLDSIVGVN